MKARHILFAFAAILLIGCSESDESISARVAKTRADEARVLFMQDIADLEMQVEKLVKKNEANNKKNERLIQANKKLRQENTRLGKQLEDVKKEVSAKKQKERDAAQARLAWQKLFPPKAKKKFGYGDKVGAYTMAQLIVEQFVKSPGTISYGGWFEQTASNCVKQYANGEYVVTGWFDAQNSFGGTVRTHYTVKLKCTDNETYKLVEMPTFSQR